AMVTVTIGFGLLLALASARFAAICFWVCSALIVYAYVGYPLVIGLASRLVGGKRQPAEWDDRDLPMISLLIAAYNEEAEIEGRIRNALELDYPREKLEIVVGSDGSDDGTASIVRSFADARVRLLDYPTRRGKASVLNHSVPSLAGEIVLLSDA